MRGIPVGGWSVRRPFRGIVSVQAVPLFVHLCASRDVKPPGTEG